MARRRRRREPAFWLVIAALVAGFVLLWPARRAVPDTIGQLTLLGYRCDRLPESESIYFCADASGRNQTDPEAKTSLWLYSPYQVLEAEALMDDYCPQVEPLWQAGLDPTGWEVDRQLLIMPHELYARADLAGQFPDRQARLEADLAQVDRLGQAIELQTRCIWYTKEPAGGSLI